MVVAQGCDGWWIELLCFLGGELDRNWIRNEPSHETLLRVDVPRCHLARVSQLWLMVGRLASLHNTTVHCGSCSRRCLLLALLSLVPFSIS